jgi:hypothetical protein
VGITQVFLGWPGPTSAWRGQQPISRLGRMLMARPHQRASAFLGFWVGWLLAQARRIGAASPATVADGIASFQGPTLACNTYRMRAPRTPTTCCARAGRFGARVIDKAAVGCIATSRTSPIRHHAGVRARSGVSGLSKVWRLSQAVAARRRIPLHPPAAIKSAPRSPACLRRRSVFCHPALGKLPRRVCGRVKVR